MIFRLLATTPLSLLWAVHALAAPISLDSSNWLGAAGAHYWRITSPGSYYLNFPGSSLTTTNEYVVRIEVGNVTLDGAGKLITGTAPPSTTAAGTPSLYGVRVNGGTNISSVRVTNLQVSNKYFGVIFEAVTGGAIDNVTATGNQHGIYFWQTARTTIRSNVASNNLIAGIMCDANATSNTSNTISGNVTDNNGNSGIWLWDACTGNTVTSNASRDNGQMGIALSTNANANQVTFNVVEGNSTGVWLESNGNTVANNVSQANSNVGILLQGVSGNTVELNTLLRNQNAGFWLDGASSNTIRRNTSALNKFWGIFLANGSAGQTIYDNYFDNDGNAGLSSAGSNAWNIPLTAGMNAVGGPSQGGNFWATPAHTGFSETAGDADQNGIADAPYSIGAGNVDALPLRAKSRAVPTDSLDADRRADLVFRHPASGDNAVWFMNGTTASGQYLPAVPDSGWTIVGRGNFDGDGNEDLLWRHSDGRNAVWFMNGTSMKPTSGYLPAVADANWQVVGTGDFDGDGFDDILWRHALTGQYVVWFVRGLALRTATFLPAVDASWRVAGIADFDGAGKAEILWRNVSSGQNALWWFDSYTGFAGALIAPAASNWSVAGVGDFNGDGKADILWRSTTGQNVMWFQDGITTMSTASIAPASTDWSVGFVGDESGDGKADIVWRNTSGLLVVWIMNGGSLTSSGNLGNPAGWNLVH